MPDLRYGGPSLWRPFAMAGRYPVSEYFIALQFFNISTCFHLLLPYPVGMGRFVPSSVYVSVPPPPWNVIHANMGHSAVLGPRDGFEDSMFEAMASSLRGQSQGQWSWLLKKLIIHISHQNPIVKLTTKRLSKHKLSTKLSLSLHHTA